MRKTNLKKTLFGLALLAAAGLLAFAATGEWGDNSSQPASTPAIAQSQPAQTSQDTGDEGIRTTDPMKSGSEELPPLSNVAPPPGAAETMPRSFENAPPQIPHSIEGLVPITLTNNACLSCHAPDVAPSVGATPIPPTHLKIDLFSKSDNDKLVVDPSRYNCTLCHVPQENVQPPVTNVFQPDFRNPEAKDRSTLYDQWNEGIQ